MQTRKLIIISFFAAITAICSIIIIPLPFSPVPFSSAIIAVFLTGALLPKREALVAQLIYLFIGTIGIPVFSGFRAGIGALFGPTGGYLLAYPIMAFLISFSIERARRYNFLVASLGMLSALMLCYIIGTAWLIISTEMNLVQALLAGVLPFVIADLIKVAVTASIAVTIRKRIINMLLS